MNRVILVVLVALLTVLAGCSGMAGGGAAPADDGDGGDSGAAASDGGGDGSSDGESDSGASAGDGGSGDTGAPELRMFQFEQVERYEYDVTTVDGMQGELIVDVESVADGTATVTITYTVNGETVSRTHEVPAGDSEAFVDAASAESYTGAVFILQSEDATRAFVEDDIEWTVGNAYEEPAMEGNITVTGRETIAGVECLTYESVISGTVIQSGCVTTDLELASRITQEMPDGSVRWSITLTDYQQG